MRFLVLLFLLGVGLAYGIEKPRLSASTIDGAMSNE